jgi:hypothetical protein
MKKIVALVAAVLCAAPAFAGDKGIIKLSLWDDVAIAAPNNINDVRGVSLGIGSTVDSIYGFQWDLIRNHSREVRGIQSSWIYNTSDVLWGAQSALGLTINRGELRGIQGSAVTINERELTGAQFGVVNIARGHVTGAQLGAVNYNTGSTKGLEAGFVNWNEGHVSGVQLGLVNYARDIYGLQVGLVNIAENGYFPVMVLVNGRF